MFHPARQLQNSIRKSVCGSAVATVASYLRKKPSYVIVKNVVPAMYVRWLAAKRNTHTPNLSRSMPSWPTKEQGNVGIAKQCSQRRRGQSPTKALVHGHDARVVDDAS